LGWRWIYARKWAFTYRLQDEVIQSAVLGIGDEDKEDHLQNTEDLHLELVVLEDEHAFLYLPWLED
jgi:hypothetical protein